MVNQKIIRDRVISLLNTKVPCKKLKINMNIKQMLPILPWSLLRIIKILKCLPISKLTMTIQQKSIFLISNLTKKMHKKHRKVQQRFLLLHLWQSLRKLKHFSQQLILMRTFKNSSLKQVSRSKMITILKCHK